MTPRAWRRYLRVWGSDLEAEVDDEFQFHFETEVEELVAHGMSADDARAEALRRFGDVDFYRRYCRAADGRRVGRARRMERLNVLAQDLRFALRTLRRQPAFTTVAVLTLALGIGATTAIFSVVDGVLLEPLPYREPGRLVTLWETTREGDRVFVSYPNYVDWRARQRGFEDIALYNPFQSFNMTGRGDTERVNGASVTGNFYGLLGVRPAFGRLIYASDDAPGSPRVAVLGHSFFQTRFGGDASVIGSTLMLDGAPHTVVGVLPPEARLPGRDVIVPVGLFVNTPNYVRESHPGLIGLGRLAAGVSLEQARVDLQRVSAELRSEYPRENAGISSGGEPLMDVMVGRIKPALLILMVAVGILLLIACTNVANLLLSRSAARQREFALRTALGAGRDRIVRQLLTESVVLALAGGALGVGMAYAGVKLLVSLEPEIVPRLLEIALDGTVLLFALGVSVFTGVLFGLAPALHSGRSQPARALKEAGRGTSGGASRPRTRAVLTAAEVALAVLLLAGAGLLVRSFVKLTAVDPGFDPAHTVAGLVRLPSGKYTSAEQQRTAWDQLLEKVHAIPGVERATISSDLPLNTNWQTGVSFDGRFFPPGEAPLLNAAVVDPGYFETVRIPLLAGRNFSAADGPDQPPVVVISETIAKRFFADANPVGQRMKEGLPDDPNPWRTIVGVVRDTKTDGLSQAPRGTFYLTRTQEDSELGRGWLIVRSNVPPEQLTPALRRALAEVDKDVPLALARTMEAMLDELVQEPRFAMLLLAIFAGVALVLASVGIYGVVSYNVSQRIDEIGVRMALGARRRDVVGLVVRQVMTMAGAGVTVGILLALWGGKSLSSLLFGVGPRDPLVLVAVSAFLLLVAMAAAIAPALRAARVDPSTAMRAS